jgi:hypothetical protein
LRGNAGMAPINRLRWPGILEIMLSSRRSLFQR